MVCYLEDGGGERIIMVLDEEEEDEDKIEELSIYTRQNGRNSDMGHSWVHGQYED